MFHGRAHRTRRLGRTFFLAQIRIRFIELPDFACGPPAEVAVASVPQIRKRDLLEAPRCEEARGEFVGEGLIVDEAVYLRRADGLLVQALGIELAAFKACNLGTH